MSVLCEAALTPGLWMDLKLTQQLSDVIQGLSPEEQHPITPRVAGEALLAAMFLLFSLYKVCWHVEILGDNSVPCGESN